MHTYNMAYSNTLIVKRLPKELSEDEIISLLKHIGAIKVVVYESKVKNHSALAQFKTAEVAKEALFRLHQKEILGSRLVVEFSKNSETCDLDPLKENTDKQKTSTEDKKTEIYEAFCRNITSWTFGLNLTLPPPHHLRYRYPPPSAEVLLNIVNLLVSSKKFYTQVIHLMNKMNLPSPFESPFSLSENEIFSSFITFILENFISKEENNDNELVVSSSESELESTDEDEKKKLNTVLPMKRFLPQKKPMKKRKFVKPMENKSNLKSVKMPPVTEVFEKTECKTPNKKISIKL